MCRLHKLLIHYVKNDDFEMVEILIDSGANINSEDEYDKTALDYSLEKGNLEIVKFLIDNGADVKNYSFALSFASQYGHSEIVELLKTHGARR